MFREFQNSQIACPGPDPVMVMGGHEIRALRKNLGKDAGDLVEGSL